MNYLERLLQGAKVEWKPLGEVAEISDGFPLNSKEIVSDGKYPVIRITNISNGKVLELDSYISKLPEKVKPSQIISGREILVGLSGSTGKTGYNELKNAIVNQRIAIIRNKNTVITNGFLKHLLVNDHFEKYCFTRGTGPQNNLSKQVLCAYLIPIPPLQVQRKIVEILDSFTELTTELTTELNARKQQYEYYREQLLTFKEGEVEWKPLGEIAIKVNSGGTPKTSESSYYGGTIPWLRTQEVGKGEIWDTEIKITESGLKNSSAKMIPVNCVIVAMYGATVGKVGINKIPLCTNQACANIQVDEKVANYRFVYYYLLNKYEYIKSLGAGSQTNINARIVKNLLIPIPPMAEQERIVGILDKFDTLTTSITEGLPKEIELRQKQYEYYRDLLLSFPKEGA